MVEPMTQALMLLLSLMIVGANALAATLVWSWIKQASDKRSEDSRE